MAEGMRLHGPLADGQILGGCIADGVETLHSCHAKNCNANMARDITFPYRFRSEGTTALLAGDLTWQRGEPTK